MLAPLLEHVEGVEPELIEQEKRGVSGIPIDAEAHADMKKWSARLGVTFPTEGT